MEKARIDLRVKLFADGADLNDMIQMSRKPFISGLTTNPTLMKKAGVSNYEAFAQDVIREIPDKPLSFEVFSDDLEEMKIQAEKISSWGKNVYVKIPVTNTKGESTRSLVRYLTQNGIKINVTALMTVAQVQDISEVLEPNLPSYVSVFAGRIADTGIDPIPTMRESLKLLSSVTKCELIWASPRELLNVVQADEIGCHVITATSDILKKLDLIGKDLNHYSLETVEMFYKDGQSAGFKI